jgi:hypothetical protein
MENITLTNTTPPAALSVVTPEIMDRKFPKGYANGQPVVYTIVGDAIQLGPTPDAVYTVSLDYYQRFAALSTTPTNWLLTNHPSVYLFAALAEASGYVFNDERIPTWEAKYQADVRSLQESDDTALRSGSAMRVRTL